MHVKANLKEKTPPKNVIDSMRGPHVDILPEINSSFVARGITLFEGTYSFPVQTVLF